MSSQNLSQREIPQGHIQRWQRIIDLMSQVFAAPAALITRAPQGEAEVLLTSQGGARAHQVSPSAAAQIKRCSEEAMERGATLSTSVSCDEPRKSARSDQASSSAHYFGVPLMWSDDHIFGVICIVFNEKRDSYPQLLEQLDSFKSLIEFDLSDLLKSQTIFVDQPSDHKSRFRALKKTNDILESIFSTTHLLVAYMDRNFEFLLVTCYV